jgi:dihydroorotate dehydrogenase
VLVVSVVGTPRPGGGEASLLEDFVLCARWAAAAGADIVEANFSCPNVSTAEGSVFQDAVFSRRLARALRGALPSTPLFIKSGHFEDLAALRRFYRAVDRAADAVVLVNGVSRRVVRADGEPAFVGVARVGILGKEIHGAAVSNVREAVEYSRKRGLAVRTVAVGGVMHADDPAPFFAAGAAGVVLGGAPMLDPYLAVKIKSRHPEW